MEACNRADHQQTQSRIKMTATMDSLEFIQGRLRGGTLSCAQLIEQYLLRIDATTDLNAYVEVYREEAMMRAQELDAVQKRASRALGKLWGAVFSIKDVISHKGHGLTAGSRMLAGYEPLFSATAVQRLLAEDAIIIGRINCDEFAMGSDNEHSYHGPVRNAANRDRISGGSSGGSAVSVQSRTCLMSLGSDTGGSMRQPASFCDIIGFKPSYGRISRHGLIAYRSSFDQIGILGRDISDLQQTYQILAGPDAFDGTLVDLPVAVQGRKKDGPLRIGYIKEALEHKGLQKDISYAFHQTLDQLREDGRGYILRLIGICDT
jgi:aspartyl-tRNA(Asn)/glutamyl-tRNA(Gln) amidotransferase subunit A